MVVLMILLMGILTDILRGSDGCYSDGCSNNSPDGYPDDSSDGYPDDSPDEFCLVLF